MKEQQAAVAWLEKDYDTSMSLSLVDWRIDQDILVEWFRAEGAGQGLRHTASNFMFTIKDQNG